MKPKHDTTPHEPVRPQLAAPEQPGSQAALIRALAEAALAVARQHLAAGVVHLPDAKEDDRTS